MQGGTQRSTGDRELAAALEAARGGNHGQAQDLAWQSLRFNPRREAAWLLLASLVPTREDQEMCLRQVLAQNPEHAFACTWFDKVSLAEHPDALSLPFLVDDTTAPPPPARTVSLDTVPLPVMREVVEPVRKQGPRPRILVVDDSPTVRRVVSLALERLGCDVATAASGIEALSTVSQYPPDLVLLDVGLPNLDGHQVCRALKRHQSTRHIPVIMLTGRDGVMDRLRGKMAGASEYLTKPFDPQALTAVVNQYVRLGATAKP